jgi:hypothetical protein
VQERVRLPSAPPLSTGRGKTSADSALWPIHEPRPFPLASFFPPLDPVSHLVPSLTPPFLPHPNPSIFQGDPSPCCSTGCPGSWMVCRLILSPSCSRRAAGRAAAHEAAHARVHACMHVLAGGRRSGQDGGVLTRPCKQFSACIWSFPGTAVTLSASSLQHTHMHLPNPPPSHTHTRTQTFSDPLPLIGSNEGTPSPSLCSPPTESSPTRLPPSPPTHPAQPNPQTPLHILTHTPLSKKRKLPGDLQPSRCPKEPLF